MMDAQKKERAEAERLLIERYATRTLKLLIDLTDHNMHRIERITVLSQQQRWKVLNGRNRLRGAYAYQLCSALGVPFNALFPPQHADYATGIRQLDTLMQEPDPDRLEEQLTARFERAAKVHEITQRLLAIEESDQLDRLLLILQEFAAGP